MTKNNELETEVFLGVCILIVLHGACVAAVALGAGLIWLEYKEAFGLAILSFGCGSLYGLTFGARAIARAIKKTFDKREGGTND
jgi:hypothetical protein